jgi:hypothetical protein
VRLHRCSNGRKRSLVTSLERIGGHADDVERRVNRSPGCVSGWYVHQPQERIPGSLHTSSVAASAITHIVRIRPVHAAHRLTPRQEPKPHTCLYLDRRPRREGAYSNHDRYRLSPRRPVRAAGPDLACAESHPTIALDETSACAGNPTRPHGSNRDRCRDAVGARAAWVPGPRLLQGGSPAGTAQAS